MKNVTVFDLETTGLDKKKDFIIQFSAIEVNPYTNAILREYNTLIKPSENYSIEISAYYKHGISPQKLENAPFLKDIKDEIINMFKNQETGEWNDVMTYNGSNFDIPFLKYRLNKFGADIDFQSMTHYDIWKEERRRHSTQLEKTFARYTGQTMKEAGLSAHDAMSDVLATYEIFNMQRETAPVLTTFTYGEDALIGDVEFDGKEEPGFLVGKYKGLPIRIIAQLKEGQEYLKWICSANFFDTTKDFIKKYIK